MAIHTTIKVMHSALVTIRSLPREMGSTKLLVTPVGGKRAGRVKLVEESFGKAVEAIIAYA